MVIKENNGFTILEIVIAMTISLVVMLIISYFIGEVDNKIASSQNKSKIYIGVNDLIEKINSKKNQYFSSKILVSGTGSYNVLLLTNSSTNGGLLIGVVNLNSGTIDNSSNYNNYDKKVIGIKEINKYQVDKINTNIGNLYTIDFYDDNVFPDLNMKSFTLTPFNSGAITEANFTFYENYLPEYKGKNTKEVQNIQTYDLTLDF